MTKGQPLMIDGKTIDEWDSMWVTIDGGLKRRQPQLAGEIGLYRCLLDNKVAALGTAIDIKDGMTKRLFDFIRPSNSGRNHHASQLIFKHRDQLVVQVLPTGSGRQAQWFARQLKPAMMARHKPIWNLAQGPRPSAKDRATAARRQAAGREVPARGFRPPVAEAASQVQF